MNRSDKVLYNEYLFHYTEYFQYFYSLNKVRLPLVTSLSIAWTNPSIGTIYIGNKEASIKRLCFN